MGRPTRKPTKLRCFVAIMDLSGKTTLRSARAARVVQRKNPRSDWNVVGDDLRAAMSQKKTALTIGR